MGMPQVCLVTKVHNNVTVIDPFSLKYNEISTDKYLMNPFDALLNASYLIEFEVMDVQPIREKLNGKSRPNKRYDLAEVEIVKSSELGAMDAKTMIVKSHLGRLLKCGDTVLGYDIQSW